MVRIFFIFLILLSGAFCSSNRRELFEPEPPPVTLVDITPSDTTLFRFRQFQLHARPITAEGDSVPSCDVRWRSNDTTIALVELDGLVTGIGQGETRIAATVDCGRRGSVQGSAMLRVFEVPVDSVVITPSEVTVNVGATSQFRAMTLDSAGNRLLRDVTWSVSDPEIARIDNDGRATLLFGNATTTIHAVSETITASATLQTDGAIVFRTLTVGDTHACGVTPAATAYCWGENRTGALGDGTQINRTRPVPVATDEPIRRVAAGNDFTCAVTLSGRALCWGLNDRGQLGSGTPNGHSTVPVPVAGAEGFTNLSAGGGTVCAFRSFSTGSIVCWGDNRFGQAGVGSREPFIAAPTPVSVTQPLNQLSVGVEHACATTFNPTLTFCWGRNRHGQLGDGTLTSSTVPVPVAGEARFRGISAGDGFTCATFRRASSQHLVYCWGKNSEGQLGDGTTTDRTHPDTVAFQSSSSEGVRAGNDFACGNFNGAFCWGSNEGGRLGTGELKGRLLVPVARVFGIWSFLFGTIDLGGSACSLTGHFRNRAVCWGPNGHGQLGNGTTTDRKSPTPVIAP